jgi:hypothetical protein
MKLWCKTVWFNLLVCLESDSAMSPPACIVSTSSILSLRSSTKIVHYQSYMIIPMSHKSVICITDLGAIMWSYLHTRRHAICTFDHDRCHPSFSMHHDDLQHHNNEYAAEC